MTAFAQRRDTFPIERFENRDTGEVVYLPLGQTFVDNTKSLERDELLFIERDEDGARTAVFVLAPEHPRVLCWKLGVNHAARRCGHADVFKDLPINVIEDVTGRMQVRVLGDRG